MIKDILLQMVANKRGGIDPSSAILSAIMETLLIDPNTDCRLEFDSTRNNYKVLRYWKVEPDETDLENTSLTDRLNKISLSKAQESNPASKVGDFISKEIEIDFSRIEFQRFKRLFSMEVRKAERSRIAEAYRSRIGEVLIGAVRRQQFSREGIILELEEDIELFLPHDEMIPKEEIRLNDRVYVYLHDIDPLAKGPQLLVSRKAPGLLAGLFKLKILEVESGVIEVRSVARDPGSRAKVAVKTNDGRLNPIGTCIGRSGERVQAISNELNGEHIDIILWDENPAQLAIHALAPAEVISITMDEDMRTMDIITRNEDLPRAIGRNGQNVRLASQITGWTLNIISAEDAEKKDIETSSELEQLFSEQLSIEPSLSKKLIQQGLSTIEEIAATSEQDLTDLLGLESAQIENILNRANDLLLAKAFAAESETFNQSDHQDESLISLKGMTPELLTRLAEHNIHTREALAELSIDDLLEIASLRRETAGQLIMNARAHWFKESEKV